MTKDIPNLHTSIPRTSWLGGPIGSAVDVNVAMRLKKFIRDEESEPIQIFAPSWREQSTTGDWYGEHAGKWLVASAHAWHRTGDAELLDSITRVVTFLLGTQEASGYLGTYAASAPSRLSHPEGSQNRTWDVWTHAWMILGLLAVNDIPGCSDALSGAQAIGEWLIREFDATGKSILDYGNHQGLSSAIVVEPLARLAEITRDFKFATFGQQILDALESRGIFCLTGPDRRTDVAELGTGKIYQICWLLTGMATLYRVTRNPQLLAACEYYWENISECHLNVVGGPWGGIGTHKEVFNARGFFSPTGLVETCSTASWMALNRELFELTGSERYVAAYELSLLNALLGAQDVNGSDWCYFTFPNGCRNNTYFWACCKSSGAMALEQSADLAVTATANGISINLIGAWVTEIDEGLTVRQAVAFGPITRVTVTFEMDVSHRLELKVRVPRWARLTAVQIDGSSEKLIVGEDGYISLTRDWNSGSDLELELECSVSVVAFADTLDHHGQEIVHTDFATVAWGPYVYATGLLDGFRQQETLRIPKLDPANRFQPEFPESVSYPVLRLNLPVRPPILFEPYFATGGRHDSAWRTTYLQVAWQ